MTANKPTRDTPWKIGSFTKNFTWGPSANGLRRLHTALNVGFDSKLHPVPRSLFWDRLLQAGFVPHIPSNYFVFNGTLNGENFIFPDELTFKALTSAHDKNFDRLTFFSLLLSEVGSWKGAKRGQQQPSEWARYFVIENLRTQNGWTPEAYSADSIETFLRNREMFQGGNGTRKLATNLAYFFSQAGFEKETTSDDHSWISDCIFLALDRYYLIQKPQEISHGWAIETLQKNDVADLSGPLEQQFLWHQSLVARLFTEVHGTERLETESLGTLIGVLSRDPLIYKTLPDIVRNWLKSRLFVELTDKDGVELLKNFDAEEFYESALKRIHNSVSKPSLNGNQLLALVRPDNDSD